MKFLWVLLAAFQHAMELGATTIFSELIRDPRALYALLGGGP